MKAKRRMILVAVAILLIEGGFLLRFGSPCFKIAGSSDVFSKAQIKDALTLVQLHLRDNDAIQSVINIHFNEAESNAFFDTWESGQDSGITADTCIHVTADFFTSKHSGSFEPNSFYSDFGFTLSFSNGQWTFVEGGAGYP